MLADGVAKKEMAQRTGLAYNTVKAHLRRIEAERAEADAATQLGLMPPLPYSTVPLIVGPRLYRTTVSVCVATSLPAVTRTT